MLFVFLFKYLNGFDGVVHFDDTKTAAFTIFVLADFGTDHFTGQTKHFAQLVVVHLVVELKKEGNVSPLVRMH